MESLVLNLLLGLLATLSFVWAFFSEQYRIIAIVLGFILIVIIMLSEQNNKIQSLSEENKKFNEKLKIHEQLVNMKADIQELQKKVFKK